MKNILLFAAFLLLSPFIAFAGSQTYSTPGTHTFTVPNYTGTLTVEVWGAGGAGGGNRVPGNNGGRSSWNDTIIAGGGNGGTSMSGGSGGTASGGTTNISGDPGTSTNGGSAPYGGSGGGSQTGGIAPGGGGGTYPYGPTYGGGSGAYSKRSFVAGEFTPGATITLVVGAGGALGPGGTAGGVGAQGMVKITWGDAAPPPPSSPPVCNATTDPTTKTTGTSGSQTFSTVGASNFTVPQYDGTLKVEVWGGGGGGSGGVYFHNIAPGGAGGMSCANCSRSTSATSNARGGSQTTYTGGLIANGGLGGTNASHQGPWWVIYVPASGGAGGTASGGETNITGSAGGAGFGGASPFGGAGGDASNTAGHAPGGGGGGTWNEIGGGGGGGYTSTTYTPGQLTKGSSIPVTVGAGGAPGDGNSYPGFGGAPGAVKFTWTATGQTLSLCAAGYKLKNGKCVSTAVCATCPAGQTLKTIPGNRIAATVTAGTAAVTDGQGDICGMRNVACQAGTTRASYDSAELNGGFAGQSVQCRGNTLTASCSDNKPTSIMGCPAGYSGAYVYTTNGPAYWGVWNVFCVKNASAVPPTPADGQGDMCGMRNVACSNSGAVSYDSGALNGGFPGQSVQCRGKTLTALCADNKPIDISGCPAGYTGAYVYTTNGPDYWGVWHISCIKNGSAVPPTPADGQGDICGMRNIACSNSGAVSYDSGALNGGFPGQSVQCRGNTLTASCVNNTPTAISGCPAGYTGAYVYTTNGPAYWGVWNVFCVKNASTPQPTGSLTCPTGYTLQGSECVAPDTTQCVPDTTCPAGHHIDLLTNQCVINAPTICIPGYHLDTATNQCVPDTVTDTEIVIIGTPRIVGWGTTSVINWSAEGATSCTGTGFDTGGATSGSYTTDPLLQTTTFTLTCDTGTKSVTIEVPSCPVGYTGTPPTCTLISGTCPPGYTGTPPNCSVAASCPIGYTGTPPNCVPNANPSCVSGNICSGNNVVDSCTGALIQSCAYSCANGACVVPPPTVVSWTVAPLIVNQGATTNVSWEVRNVSSCTVSGTNGDSWTGLTGTKVSGPIPTQTVFTLHCTALPGSNAANVSRTATVNIVPVFQEK